jgi:hypothetical protein
VQGNRSKPAILTYHDLGLNCEYKQWSLIEERCTVLFYVNDECRLHW